MNIALTFNLKTDDSPQQAEFDAPETIERLTSALLHLGHRVDRVDVGGPVAHLVARLDALAPDLVFNLAEGQQGRFREGFYPALFEQMGLPYTGSDAYCCTLTLDKHLTKLALLERGLPVPPWFFLTEVEQLEEAVANLKFPLIVKPNFEGSSKGISQDSVVKDFARLADLVRLLLEQYPAGLIVEEFVSGRDVTVPYLGQALEPCEYSFSEERQHNIYDFEAKHTPGVEVVVPARLDADLRTHLLDYAERTIKATGVRDFGRVDFRVSEGGKPYVIEVNALPSLRPGTSMFAAAGHTWSGADSLPGESLAEEADLQRAVLKKIIELASERHGLKPRASKPRKSLRIGVAYNLKVLDPEEMRLEQGPAEFDSPSSIQALFDAISSSGHEVVGLEANPDFAQKVAGSDLDLVFNVAEGMRGRNRGSHVPSILELLDIPYTGSDPACLCMTLDKGLAKRIVREAGVATPDWITMTTGKERLPKGFAFPLVVKPLAEGGAQGVGKATVVESDIALQAVVTEMVRRYSQPTLVEPYLEGREFTIGVLGEKLPRVLPIMEVAFVKEGIEHPIYGFEQKSGSSGDVRLDCPASLEPELQKALSKAAKTVFKALGCRDVARIGFRLDREGHPQFLECNPLPGLVPEVSDLAVIGLAAGLSYRELVREIMAPAVRRTKLRRGHH